MAPAEPAAEPLRLCAVSARLRSHRPGTCDAKRPSLVPFPASCACTQLTRLPSAGHVAYTATPARCASVCGDNLTRAERRFCMSNLSPSLNMPSPWLASFALMRILTLLITLAVTLTLAPVPGPRLGDASGDRPLGDSDAARSPLPVGSEHEPDAHHGGPQMVAAFHRSAPPALQRNRAYRNAMIFSTASAAC